MLCNSVSKQLRLAADMSRMHVVEDTSTYVRRYSIRSKCLALTELLPVAIDHLCCSAIVIALSVL